MERFLLIIALLGDAAASGRPVTLTPDELAKIWNGIETHIATERETIDFARSALEMLQQGQGRGYLVQQYLLSHLLEDEKKH